MKGIYALVIRVQKRLTIRVGAIGRVSLSQGLYAYVGSAQNGIGQRVRHHRSLHRTTHWHIDWLLANKGVRLIKVYADEAPKDRECAVARALAEVGSFVPRFGCSDCSCRSHLISISNTRALEWLDLDEFPY